MPIRVLPPHLVYQIASGEIIERPCSVVKELLENAIDADASSIRISLRNAGKTFISVRDNGIGMNLTDIRLATKHHATSKLATDNLEDIKTLGFRGEALPSISAVSQMSITSKPKENEYGWTMRFNDQHVQAYSPTACESGTCVEIRNLFYKTPNRLNFLKTPEWELQATLKTFKRLAMAYPSIAFSLKNDKKTNIKFLETSFEKRIADILGEPFKDNFIPVEDEKDYIKLKGLVSLPSFTQPTANSQYLFVNRRPVNNRVLSSAIRVAYEGLLFRHRYPVVVLFVDLPGDQVDVNIHPKKHEVRFKEEEFVNDTIKEILKKALAKVNFAVSTSFGEEILNLIETESDPTMIPHNKESLREEFSRKNEKQHPLTNLLPQHLSDKSHPLGQAIGQLYNTFIISEGEEKFFIVDQHAAHERLLYEEMKNSLKERGLKSSPLNPPLQIKTGPDQRFDVLIKYQEELKHFGFNINFSSYPRFLIVEGMPEILGEVKAKSLLSDLVEEILEFGEPLRLSEHVHQICSTLSCHLSIKGGERLNFQQLNQLLRQIENVNYSGQCNHGRPTYLSLRKKDLERIFRRNV
jgi:DNA mismatch repair protein MutL